MLNKIKVLIVDDHSVVRKGLKMFLESNPSLEVCGEAGGLGDAIRMTAKTKPDVIVLDFKLPDGDGINGSITIKARFPDVKIIILTAYTAEEPTTTEEENESVGYENGRYRGIYGDGGEQQVSVQFDLEDNIISNVSFRHLYYSGTDYRKLEEGEVLYPILQQHEQIVEYLEGKPLSAIFDLHTPGDFIEDIDTFTGATIRGNKVFSSIVDGLNRGLY